MALSFCALTAAGAWPAASGLGSRLVNSYFLGSTLFFTVIADGASDGDFTTLDLLLFFAVADITFISAFGSSNYPLSVSLERFSSSSEELPAPLSLFSELSMLVLGDCTGLEEKSIVPCVPVPDRAPSVCTLSMPGVS